MRTRTFRVLGMPFDILAEQRLHSICKSFIPQSGSAARSSAILIMANDIILNNRRILVEFGAGSSTLYLGALAAAHNRAVYSIEHNEEFVEVMRRLVSQLGLSNFVQIIHAPLSDNNLVNGSKGWYDHNIVSDALPRQNIDLIFVDGPPAYERLDEQVRYPAVPILADRISDSCIIFLDDIGRRSERSTIARWGAELNLTPQYLGPRGSMGYLVRGTYNYFLQ